MKFLNIYSFEGKLFKNLQSSIEVKQRLSESKVDFSLLKLLPVIFFCTFISACAVNPISGQIGKIGDDEYVIEYSLDQYRSLIEEKSNEGLVDTNPVVVKRVQDITNKIIDSAKVFVQETKAWNWEIHVIKDDEMINASCYAGGKIVIYTGIIDRLKLSDDELASVIGHEIAHALFGHNSERLALANLQKLIVDYYAEKKDDVEKAERIQAVSNLLITLPFSRANEMEADMVGSQLAYHAGFDPTAGVTLWEKMSEQDSSSFSFLSTHPLSTDRVKSLGIIAGKLVSNSNKENILITVLEKYKSFMQGEILLKDTIYQASVNGWNADLIKEYYANQSWKDLAILLIGAGRHVDINYFYLGETARNLGYFDAAKIYYSIAYQLSKEDDLCGELFDYQCNGINVRKESQNWL